MSQDGRGQLITKDVISDDRLPGFDCTCGGWVYARTKSLFAKCSKGMVHCLRCKGEAHRFRRGLTCGNGCLLKEL